MLTIVDKRPVWGMVLRSDHHLAVDYRSLDNPDGIASLYVRSARESEQVIEIGVDHASGQICTVVVAALGRTERTPDCWRPGAAEVEGGLPVCDMSIWPPYNEIRYWEGEGTIFEPRPWESLLGADFLALRLPGTEIARWYRAGPGLFGIDEDSKLVAICFWPLPECEVNRITAILDRYPDGGHG